MPDFVFDVKPEAFLIPVYFFILMVLFVHLMLGVLCLGVAALHDKYNINRIDIVIEKEDVKDDTAS